MNVTESVAPLLHLLLPAPCLGCGAPLPAAGAPLDLCLRCRGGLPAHRPGCPRCGAPLPERRRASRPCLPCRRHPPAFAHLAAPWAFAAPVDAVLHHLKFRRRSWLGADLGRELARWVRERPGGALFSGTRLRAEVVVPVPLHRRRRWRRGYNQAELVARPLAAGVGLPLCRALVRRRATRPQTGLDRHRRWTNVEGAFAVPRRRAAAVAGRRLLLVDDVATTGATLGAAARCLRRAGATRVDAVALARAPGPVARRYRVEPSGGSDRTSN